MFDLLLKAQTIHCKITEDDFKMKCCFKYLLYFFFSRPLHDVNLHFGYTEHSIMKHIYQNVVIQDAVVTVSRDS